VDEPRDVLGDVDEDAVVDDAVDGRVVVLAGFDLLRGTRGVEVDDDRAVGPVVG